MPLGVHFAITDEQRKGLESQTNDEDRINYVKDVIDAAWDEDFLQPTDKAWDAIHRCLSDFPPDTPWFYDPVNPEKGTCDLPEDERAFALPEDHGTYPLKLCVLGGKRLQTNEYHYFIRLIEPHEVPDIVAALKPVDKAWLREKYFTHCRGAWPEFGEEDFEYTWEYFDLLRAFFERMAGNGRAIIFTADQ